METGTMALAHHRHIAALLRRAAGALLALTATGGLAASFDCSKAATRQEQLICADAELSRLDSELGQRYAEARRSADDPAALRRAQREWLVQRNRCGDSDCLAAAYRERIAALSASADGAAERALGQPQTQRTAQEVRLVQQDPELQIDATYPRLGESQAAKAAEQVLAAVVQAELDDFRQAHRELLAATGRHEGPPWQLSIDYDQVYTAPHFWAVGLRSYAYTGGAHGGVQHRPVILERSTGAQVPTHALFRRGSVWLPMLADYCYSALAGGEPFSANDDWLRAGTAPEADNYQKLLPLADGLRVIFEQYQVGPYAIGVHEVKVPYGELDGLLRPDLFPQGRP